MGFIDDIKGKVVTSDAIQLATGIFAQASFFLTNDHALQKFPDINVHLVDTLF